jgi:hypothetical protein
MKNPVRADGVIEMTKIVMAGRFVLAVVPVRH